MKDDIKGIENFLNAFSAQLSSEEHEMFNKIIHNSKIPNFEGPSEFNIVIQHQWKKFIKGYIKTFSNSNSDIEFIYINYSFLRMHLSSLFSKYEGSSCSADKCRTIINSLEDWFKYGNKISFDYSSEYTYHFPKIILKNHEDIIEYYNGLKHLYFGNPDNYLLSLKKILEHYKNHINERN